MPVNILSILALKRHSARIHPWWQGDPLSRAGRYV